MITTVTTTTVTTVTAIAAMGLTSVITGAAVAVLILFLATKELASARSSGTSLRVARFLSIGILPLAMTFMVTMAIKMVEALT